MDYQDLASPSEADNDAVIMPVSLVFIASGLAGNFLILLVIRTSRNFSRVTRHLIGHLAITDMIFAANLVTHHVFRLTKMTSYHACVGITCGVIVSGICSCLGICLVFLDKYIAVRALNTTKGGLSLQKARICIVSCWIISILYSLIYLLNAPKETTTLRCVVGESGYTYVSIDISMGGIIYSVNHSPICHDIIPLDCEEENEYFDPRTKRIALCR